MQFHDDMIDDTGTVIKWGGMDIHLSCINEINFSLILIVGDTLHSIDGLITYVLLEIMVQKERLKYLSREDKLKRIIE